MCTRCEWECNQGVEEIHEKICCFQGGIEEDNMQGDAQSHCELGDLPRGLQGKEGIKISQKRK